MNFQRKIYIFFTVISMLLLAGCASADIDMEVERARFAEQYIGNALPVVQLDSLVAEKQLVPESRNNAYSIDDRVGIEDEYYVFNIYTPHGTVTAKGLAALVEYCYDAEILEMLLSSNFGDFIQPLLTEGVDMSNTEVVDARVYNVDSIAGIGRRFNEVYTDESGAEVARDRIADRNMIYGAYYDVRRLTLAYKLGLDAYSANPYVQAFLNALLTLPQDELQGILGKDLIEPEINIDHGRKNIDASVQSREFFPGSRNVLLESRLVNSDPDTIRTKLMAYYRSMFRDTDPAGVRMRDLVYSSAYSIREELYIFAYLNDMGRVRDKSAVVNLLAGADTAFQAKQYYLQLQLLHAYYASLGGLERFVAFSDMIGAIVDSSQIIVIPTWDHTRDRDEVRKLLVEVKNLKDTVGAANASIWFVGDCDKNTVKTAGKVGINIRSGVAATPMFRFTNYRRLTYRFEKGDPLVRNAARLTPNAVTKYQRTNRVVPTPLLPDEQNPAKAIAGKEATIAIEEPDKPKPLKHDPRNWREFGFGVKVIPKEELEASPVPGIGTQGVGEDLLSDETGSGDGKLPAPGEDPVQVDSERVF